VDLREKRVDQRRLADARLAGHEDELTLPAQHLPQQLVKPPDLGVAPDQRRG
jgi:hypothetical protein